MSSKADRSTGYAAVFATVVIWSVPSLFQYYLNNYYDPWAQNFYRYSAACLAIVPFLFLRSRQPGAQLSPRLFWLCFLACLPNVVHQVGQVLALYYMGPGVYAIFGRTSVIFTALLALAFFPEERYVIRQWQFQAGTALGLAGAFGVLWFQPGAESSHISVRGVLIAIIATFCWALYGVLIKRPSAQLGSIRSFGVVSVVTSSLFLPLTLAFGNLATPAHVG
ncbi:MAG TPA: DMT family transporter, partial [Chthoniobacterales bacterium]